MQAIILPAMPGQPIPTDPVDILVKIDKTRCDPGESLSIQDDTWIQVSMFEIVVRGMIHFSDMTPQPIAGESVDEFFQRRVWQEMVAFSPHTIVEHGKRRLRFPPIKNKRERARLSELLGEAIGALVAERAWAVSRVAFSRRDYELGVRHDFDVTLPGGIAKLETRGRFNRSQRSAAMSQIDDKFKTETRNYSRSMAALVYPYDKQSKKVSPDVELVDPEGEATPPGKAHRIRAVLRHYREYAVAQNFAPLASRFSALIALRDDELLTAFSTDAAAAKSIGPEQQFGPSQIDLEGRRFVGTIRSALPVPAWLSEKASSLKEGSLFLGLSSLAIDTLSSSGIDSLLDWRVVEPNIATNFLGTTLLQLADGTLAALATGDNGLGIARPRLRGFDPKMLVRDRMLERLTQDLVGPLEDREVLSDRPTQRYSTGILYPRGSPMGPAENEDGVLAAEKRHEADSSQEEAGVSLHAALKPATAGLSFAVQQEGEENVVVEAAIACALYKRVTIDAGGEEVLAPGSPHDRAHERWRRMHLAATVPVPIRPGENRIDLAGHGIPGMELYVLVTPHSGVLTVTVAVSNLRMRGDSSAYDEEQHFFQVTLTVRVLSRGVFAPRPSRRAQTDDDSRTAALIYRDVQEYAVGHTCSARAILENGQTSALRTDWVPSSIVPAVSDRGDAVFDSVRVQSESRPLDAKWLAAAPPQLLIVGLESVVAAYRAWILSEEARIPGLPGSLRERAATHMERCRRGADRMGEGISAIANDSAVRTAFQLAQRAMLTQFEWTRPSQVLEWRPFQLAFQLLVLSSLADRAHLDRDTMDLLWFPTGGGKTESYLALTAFIIILRRLRASKGDDGSGVAVLMRYTLRLLTVQQFQRAAAMILACEFLRRRGQQRLAGIPYLGETPIGIGLWVGAAATPLTLKDAVSRTHDDPSTPEQLTICPACGSRLKWRVTSKESIVECTANSESCALFASGPRLPVWTIDEEVYREAPSLVIGTVDKFAQIVRKLETRALFGRGALHSPPDLIIQDELHLIAGPLGSIAGLYEVAIDELCRRDAIRVKIIGSTATIRRAADQIASLFDRRTYQFPAPGLDAGNSGFAVADRRLAGRLYVGISTAGRSATYMLQAIVSSLLQGACEPGIPDDERNYYWTLVSYFNSLRELGRALVLMQDDVPISIGQFASRRGESRRRLEAPAELTSRVRSYEIRDMLERLNKPASDPEAVDLLVASNMISVGMDIPRLGLMVVNAQPKTLAEYIQATSRVGRGKVPGLVVTMYNSMRARDRSHFETFETWHRALYRDVEASSVTPFAARAQDKALHAVLVALVRHTVPGMEKRPSLNALRRQEVERVASLIESRILRVDINEHARAAQKLKDLIDEWSSRTDLQEYWDDFDKRTSLLMSAEQFAAKVDVDPDLDPEGFSRALWPTPNSMREVEAGAPFVLRHVLTTGKK